MKSEKMLNNKQIRLVLDTFYDMFPDADIELKFENPFELVIAVLLSAQCTDVLVNKVTDDLFKKYKTPEDYLAVDIEELQDDIRSIGLYRSKAKNIQKLCQKLINEHNGEVPQTRSALEALAGVGRKTANVVMSVAFKEPTIADRKSTRLNSSHVAISYAVFCLKKKRNNKPALDIKSITQKHKRDNNIQ